MLIIRVYYAIQQHRIANSRRNLIALHIIIVEKALHWINGVRATSTLMRTLVIWWRSCSHQGRSVIDFVNVCSTSGEITKMQSQIWWMDGTSRRPCLLRCCSLQSGLKVSMMLWSILASRQQRSDNHSRGWKSYGWNSIYIFLYFYFYIFKGWKSHWKVENPMHIHITCTLRTLHLIGSAMTDSLWKDDMSLRGVF